MGKSLISMVRGFQQAMERMTPEGKCWTSFGFFLAPQVHSSKDAPESWEKFGEIWAIAKATP